MSSLYRSPDWRERGRLRDELLNGEIFYTLREAQTSSRAGGATKHRPASRRPRLQAAGTKGLRPGILRVAGCAGVRASVKLTNNWTTQGRLVTFFEHPMNAITVIPPYKHHGMWVFDDPRVGLV